jgi:superfamily II DNA or RNA helicase
MSDLNHVLTAKGYAINKDSLSVKEQQALRQALTVTPQSASRFGVGSQPFAVYFESPQRLYVPRHWAQEQYGPPAHVTLPEGADLPNDLEFKGKPFDYQESIIKQFTDSGGNGLICVPCGKGKTFMALAIAYCLRKRFMVIVDKEFLLNQWKGEIQQFFPGLRIGILQGSRLEIEPDMYDVTLCMLQTLCQREFPSATFKTFGFTIFDECHHLGAAHFSRALLKVQTKYMLGLSATPVRDDGLTKVFEWYLGKPVYWEKQREADPSVTVRAIQFKTTDTSYTQEPVDYKGEVIMARLLTQIVEFEERTALIIRCIRDLGGDPARRILVLSERKKHLERMEEILNEQKSGLTIGYYVGGMKEAVREDAGKNARVLLATYAMASEAMNIKSLNAVILASPRKKVEQSVGRILRERPGERVCQPMILDIIDSHGMYQGQFRKRRVFYKACGYKIMSQTCSKEDEDKEDNDEDEDEDKDNTKKDQTCGFIDD